MIAPHPAVRDAIAFKLLLRLMLLSLLFIKTSVGRSWLMPFQTFAEHLMLKTDDASLAASAPERQLEAQQLQPAEWREEVTTRLFFGVVSVLLLAFNSVLTTTRLSDSLDAIRVALEGE